MKTVYVLTIGRCVVMCSSYLSSIEKYLATDWNGGGIKFPKLGSFTSTLTDGTVFQINEMELNETYTKEDME